MADKNLLQRIVFPTVEEQECPELFVRSIKQECELFGQIMCEAVELKFDTWMNIFAAKKWYHYCDIGKLFMGLQICGDFVAEIYGTKHNAAYIMINELLYSSEYHTDSTEQIDIEVPDADMYDAIYARVVYPAERKPKIVSAGWYTDVKGNSQNSLAIVTCTYKREIYTRKTMSLFREFMRDNTVLASRMHLIVVDNGQTIPIEESDEYVDIVHNINAGGAGGFGRGIIEACRSKYNYTRCLLMDDDVKILPESFLRTLLFSDYLKEEYSEAIINGAMLDLYAKNMFCENLAIQDGLWVHSSHYPGDLNDYAVVLRVNEYNDNIWKSVYPKPNAAWFYSSFKIDKEKTINDLPLPVFIRGDDVEYGWRSNGKPFIQLNGVCIWHAPFYYRVNKVTENYYMVRNMIMINMIYTDGFKNTYEKIIRRRFKDLISTYDYKSAALTIAAIKDVLSGTDAFEKDPVDLHKSMTEMAKEDEVREEDWYQLESIRNKRYDNRSFIRLMSKTLNAVYKRIPAMKKIVKRNSEKSVGEWYPPNEAFLLKKHVRIYNLLKGTYYYRHFDYDKEQNLKKEFEGLMQKLCNNYDSLANMFREEHARLVSYDFWKKYLKME